MKFTLWLLITVQLCNYCFSEVLRNIESTEDDVKCEHQFPKDKLNKTKTQLKDLDGDVLLLIFEQLWTLDLMNIANMGPQLEYFSGRVFGQRYRDYDVVIKEPVYFTNPCSGVRSKNCLDWYVDTDKKLFEISDHTIALHILKHFGRFIQRLKLDNPILRKNFSTIINRAVNEYCSESLIYLDIGTARKDTLTQYKKPFKQVEEFICYLKPKQVGLILSFARMFPKLRKLRFYVNSDTSKKIDIAYEYRDFNFIDCEIATLEQLSIGIPGEITWTQKQQIQSFIRKNPQILNIEYSFFPQGYIKEINRLLPGLESLTVHDSIGDECVHFENVRHFALHESYVPSIDNISFSQLKSVEIISYNSLNFDAWIRFFKNHQSVKKLYLGCHDSDIETKVVGVMDELPDLDVIEYAGPLSISAITSIIESHPSLLSFELSLRQLHETDLITLRKRFEHEWFIDHLENTLICYLALQKINSTVL